MIALPWKKLCANFILPCGENHYGFFLRCPTSFYNRPKYFDKQNIRLKAEDVGEKNLYGLYYDYDSSFEHGLWGAIRESSLLKCNNPAHKYHCVPDVEDETRLKTVLPDCIMIMNKTISFLDEIYGIPEQLLNEVINFEIKPIAG